MPPPPPPPLHPAAMANYLAQFQTIKSTCDRIVIVVEDVSDLWLNVKESFERRVPVKKACLNNKDLDEFKTILKPRLKLIVQNDEREWFIVFVSKAHPSNDQATKMAKKVYARLEADFNTKKRERCCKFDLYGSDKEFWDDFDSKMVDCIRNTLDRRVQFYEEEIRRIAGGDSRAGDHPGGRAASSESAPRRRSRRRRV